MNYHDKAEADIKTAKLLISPQGNPTNDELLYDNGAYHVQQAYEKELKHILHDLLGADDTAREFRTHNIADLINQIENSGYNIPDEIKEISHDLSNWEANTRYNSDILVELNEINNVIDLFDKLKECSNDIECDIINAINSFQKL